MEGWRGASSGRGGSGGDDWPCRLALTAFPRMNLPGKIYICGQWGLPGLTGRSGAGFILILEVAGHGDSRRWHRVKWPADVPRLWPRIHLLPGWKKAKKHCKTANYPGIDTTGSWPREVRYAIHGGGDGVQPQVDIVPNRPEIWFPTDVRGTRLMDRKGLLRETSECTVPACCGSTGAMMGAEFAAVVRCRLLQVRLTVIFWLAMDAECFSDIHHIIH
ncbi:hypothetical protein BDV59DRAFT_103885 [Aspergillus ambiguus]|uniref:uncharacterized protein n=1 Tax=Aspergillus ambiguus TaxID=176160 RepID=UPI003CCD3D39